VDALFAFTECEQSISVNLPIIKDGLPVVMSVTEVVKYHSRQLVKILTKELELERQELLDRLRFRTLERIFIEERIYKNIEKMRTADAVEKAVIEGFKPFMKEIGPGGIGHEDVEQLLKIPIRRISLYDINRAKKEMEEIEKRIAEISAHLKKITAYAIAWLDGIIVKIKSNEELGGGKRRTLAGKFEKIDVKEVAKKDLELKYDSKTGYLGTAVSGETRTEVSPFDRILAIRSNGIWSVTDIPEKAFIGQGAWWIGEADKELLGKTVFTVIYKEKESGHPYIKRCVIEGWIMNKEYPLVPEGAEVLLVDTRGKFAFTLHYKPKPRLKVLKESFKTQDYNVRGLKAGGIRLASKEVEKLESR
jgi:topoisomerase-4 subunit A